MKTPKLHFLDSGLLAALLGVTADRIIGDRTIFGKQAGWLDEECSLSHYRDKDQDEVDIVIENEPGELVGIEVKAAATVTASDFKGLRKLAGTTGDALKLGVVLYDGEQTVAFGDRMFAAPISCLWS